MISDVFSDEITHKRYLEIAFVELSISENLDWAYLSFEESKAFVHFDLVPFGFELPMLFENSAILAKFALEMAVDLKLVLDFVAE